MRDLAMRALAGLDPRTDEVVQFLRAGLQDQDFDLWITATQALAPRPTPGRERRDAESASSPAVMALRLPRTAWRFSRDPQPNHITVRVKNTAFAGGIWKPITLEALKGTRGDE